MKTDADDDFATALNFNRLKLSSIFCVVALLVGTATVTVADPVTVNGDPFTLVATGPGTAQLFGLASDAQGRIYIGNNSNNTTGIPVQRFDPALFSGAPLALQNFGPAVGDADGLTFGGGFIFVPDRDEGLRRIAVLGESNSILVANRATNGTGSPVVFRPGDSHLFVGFGTTVPGSPGDKRIDEFDATGAFVQTFMTTAETETMTFDPASGLIYYAPFGSEVRSFNPATRVDKLVGTSSGSVDGGLALDPLTGLIFVGTANGTNSGSVETIDPATGTRALFASGFNGTLGILREPLSGDLYVLETNQLYRLQSRFIIFASQLLNISTRLNVLRGDNVLIGGFIITGTAPKKVMLRAIGPSLPVAGALADPTLELHFPDGSVVTNDNWKINELTGQSQEVAIRATTIPPSNDLESAIVATLAPGNYTAIVRGKNSGAGVGLVEAYDLDQAAASKLANISTRGFVDTGNNVMIGGFILGPSGSGGGKVLVRAIGPSLTSAGVPGALADPTLELHNGNGALVASNDNWKINDATGQSHEAAIRATTIPPTNDLESAILTTLTPGNYTAIVAGKNGGTGVGLVEVYNLQ